VNTICGDDFKSIIYTSFLEAEPKRQWHIPIDAKDEKRVKHSKTLQRKINWVTKVIYFL
jgi:hypothetical protein